MSMIRLDDYLKSQGVVGTGGEAKVRIQSGEVRVNGDLETRRRRQLHVGDRVEIGTWNLNVVDDDVDAGPAPGVAPGGGV